MSRDLRLLEELVSKAVDRLAGLRAERDRLRDEIRMLRAELAEAVPAGREFGEGRRAEWVTELREAVAELRGD